jgi:acyl-coenzyme A thioesterase PaaI-like protein
MSGEPIQEGGTMQDGLAVQYGVAIQDQMKDNFCWGCGADNPDGLQLKSYWDGDVVVARFTPGSEHSAGPRHILNGGIIATLLDCHGVCTAAADAYRRAGLEIGGEQELWYATASLSVDFLRPTPLDEAVELNARIVDAEDRATSVVCTLSATGKERAKATVRAVRVPDEWRHGSAGATARA